MAEFCLECMNKYILPEDEQITEDDVYLDYDLCECCGEWKQCVVIIKQKNKPVKHKNFIKKLLHRIKR